MSKPNYFIYFIISVLAIFVPVSALQKIELERIKSIAIEKGYAEIVDGKFTWNDEIL